MIVETQYDLVMRGHVETFWVRTDVTPLYWDVVGEVRFALELLDSKTSRTIFKSAYQGSKIERTYLWPGEDIMQRVLESALATAISQLSADNSFAQALRIR